MHLSLEPASLSDLDFAKSYYGSSTGDLVAAAAGACWPVPDDLEKARYRAEWSFQQQKDVLKNDPSTKFVKVIDKDKNDEIVALGRWHRYTEGFQDIGDLEVTGANDRNDAKSWPEGLHKAMYIAFLDPLIEDRRKWMGTGHYWVLTNIVTREPLRKNGAGSLILNWGLKQAAEEGVPAYLEAVADAVGLYQKHGFREVERSSIDCSDFGMPGVVFEVAKMRADPK